MVADGLTMTPFWRTPGSLRAPVAVVVAAAVPASAAAVGELFRPSRVETVALLSPCVGAEERVGACSGFARAGAAVFAVLVVFIFLCTSSNAFLLGCDAWPLDESGAGPEVDRLATPERMSSTSFAAFGFGDGACAGKGNAGTILACEPLSPSDLLGSSRDADFGASGFESDGSSGKAF